MSSTSSTNSMRIFGAMELAFSNPREFSLAPQVFSTVDGTSFEGTQEEERSFVDWLGNFPAAQLLGVVANEHTSGGASSSSYTDVGLMGSLDQRNAKWPVLNLPLSGKKTVRVEVSSSSSTAAATAEGVGASAAAGKSNSTEDNYRAASLLFQQLVAAENERRRGGSSSKGTANNATAANISSPVPSSADRFLLSLLRQGLLDPNEAITADVTPTQLLFGLGELQRRFDNNDDASPSSLTNDTLLTGCAPSSSPSSSGTISSSRSSSGLSEPMRVATVSESFVRLLAWQRLGQLIGEVDAKKRLSGATDGAAAAPPVAKKARTEGGGATSDCSAGGTTASTNLYDVEEGSSSAIAAMEKVCDSRVDLFNTLAAIMAQGITSSTISTPSTHSSVASRSSRSTQCRLATAGANTTLPFADVSRMSIDDAAKALGNDDNNNNNKALPATVDVPMGHCSVASSTTSALLRNLSPIVIQIWDLRKGLLGAEVIGGEGGYDALQTTSGTSTASGAVKAESTEDATENGVILSSSDARPKILKVRLPYGVSTIGADVDNEVAVGLRALLGGATGAIDNEGGIAPHHFRVMVLPAPNVKKNDMSFAATDGSADGAAEGENAAARAATSPLSQSSVCTVNVLSCGGGGSGIRVDGLKWSYGSVLPVAAGQTVRFGKYFAMAYTNTAVSGAAAATLAKK